MLCSRNDLRYFTGAAWLRTISSHPRSAVGHRDFCPVDDGAVRFALHTVALYLRHVAHAVVLGSDIERFCSPFHKKHNISPKRGGSEGEIRRNLQMQKDSESQNA